MIDMLILGSVSRFFWVFFSMGSGMVVGFV